MLTIILVFFFQAEDGIRDRNVTGVQTCALPISGSSPYPNVPAEFSDIPYERGTLGAARTNDINGANCQWFITLKKRSEERRVGKECRSGRSTDYKKEKVTEEWRAWIVVRSVC